MSSEKLHYAFERQHGGLVEVITCGVEIVPGTSTQRIIEETTEKLAAEFAGHTVSVLKGDGRNYPHVTVDRNGYFNYRP